MSNDNISLELRVVSIDELNEAIKYLPPLDSVRLGETVCSALPIVKELGMPLTYEKIPFIRSVINGVDCWQYNGCVRVFDSIENRKFKEGAKKALGVYLDLTKAPPTPQ